MPSFSQNSQNELVTADHRLQEVFNEVIKHFDCTVMQGHRTESEQDEKFRQGLSKVQYPNSKHNSSPSLAVDVAPYPIDWNDLDRFRFFVGYVIGTADQMGIKLRTGLDWDGDKDLRDQSFIDMPHFELVD